MFHNKTFSFLKGGGWVGGKDHFNVVLNRSCEREECSVGLMKEEEL